MEIDWNAEVADQLESHWAHQLRPRLDGLTDDEYLWQPAPEPVTTIAWRLAHLIVGFAETNASHFGAPAADGSTLANAGSAEEALRQLDYQHAAWSAGVRSLGTAGLARPQGPSSPPAFADAPVVRLILYTSVEVIHHGAEICLLRDLYLRGGGRS